MKNNLKHRLLALVILVLGFASCEDDLVVERVVPPPPVQTPSSTPHSDSKNPFPNSEIVGSLTNDLPDAAVITMDKLVCLSTNMGRSEVEIMDLLNGNLMKFQLSTDRNAIAIGATDSKVLFAGGYNGTYVSTVNIYDVINNSWSIANLSQPRSMMSVASLNNKVYFAGGVVAGGLFSSRVDIYDANSNTWSTTEISEPRNNLSAAAVGNKIMFAGGLTSGNRYTDLVDIYDVASNKWTTASLSEGSYTARSVVLNDRVFFNTTATTIDIYNSNSNSWEVLKKPDQIGASQSAVSNGKIAFICGYIGWDAVDDKMRVYDPATGKWTINKLITDISGQLTLSYKNNIYSIAGILNQENTPINSVIKFGL